MPEQHVALVVLQGKDRIAGVAVQFLPVANSLVVPSTLWNCAYLPYVKQTEGVAVGSLIPSYIIYAREVYCLLSLSLIGTLPCCGRHPVCRRP